jgi:hypothetical protein
MLPQREFMNVNFLCILLILYVINFSLGNLMTLHMSTQLRVVENQPSPGPNFPGDVSNYTTNTVNLPSFGALAKASGSDKYYLHHYEHYYSKWLEPYRAIPNLTMAEIGVFSGHSLKLWSDFFLFPKVILGVAYDPGDTHAPEMPKIPNAHSSVRVVFGDQSATQTMKTICNHGPFSIIIDDGSHVPWHQMFSLYSLWPCILPGGIYIVEDTETSYWDDGSMMYNYRLNNTGIGASPNESAVEKLKQLIDVLHKEKLRYTSLSIMPGDENLCANVIRKKHSRIAQMHFGPAIESPTACPDVGSVIECEQNQRMDEQSKIV